MARHIESLAVVSSMVGLTSSPGAASKCGEAHPRNETFKSFRSPMAASKSTHVSELRLSYDRIEFVSSAWPGWLWKNLPVKELRRASHYFHIKEVDKNPYYHSRIILVCVPENRHALELLKAHEVCLFGYAVSVAEIAADALAQSDKQALAIQRVSIGTVNKRRHVRGDVIVAFDEERQTPKGFIDGPTLYHEDAHSSVAFKNYCRFDKAPAGQFTAQAIARWEWTLKTGAIQRHLGGKHLSDLLNADLPAFAAKNLNHDRVDYAAVGKLLDPKIRKNAGSRWARLPLKPKQQILADPDFWAAHTAYRILRIHWYRSLEGCSNCTSDSPLQKTRGGADRMAAITGENTRLAKSPSVW